MKRKMEKKAEYWRKQIQRAAKHAGGVRSYCEASGIRWQAFYYWKKKLGGRGRIQSCATPFTKVEVIPPAASEAHAGRMPDPKWLAEFLLSLGGAR